MFSLFAVIATPLKVASGVRRCSGLDLTSAADCSDCAKDSQGAAIAAKSDRTSKPTWIFQALAVGPITSDMHSQALAQLDKNPEWRHLLTAYHARQMLSQDGWVDRVFELSGVEDDQLSKFHGRLIALGLLDFELGGRGEGMRYQVSSLGKQTLRGVTTMEFEHEHEAEAA